MIKKNWTKRDKVNEWINDERLWSAEIEKYRAKWDSGGVVGWIPVGLFYKYVNKHRKIWNTCRILADFFYVKTYSHVCGFFEGSFGGFLGLNLQSEFFWKNF